MAYQGRKVFGRTSSIVCTALLAAVALSGCGGSATETPATSSAGQPSQPAQGQTGQLTVEDAYTKASSDSMPGMVGSFGVLKNSSDKEIRIVSARTNVSDHTELHETVEKNGQPTMQESKDGLKVPAGGSLTLEPGGYHIMLMDLKKDLKPGEEVGITLETEDGESIDFNSVVKDIAGGNESYHGSEGHSAGMESAEATPTESGGSH